MTLRPIKKRFLFLLGVCILSGLIFALFRQPEWIKSDPRREAPRVVASFNHGALTSESCRECHAEIFEDWKLSHHAWANRLMNSELDRAAFEPPHELDAGDASAKFHLRRGRPEIITRDNAGPPKRFRPEMVLAHKPLRQMLVPFDGGRWQATEAAWDPAKKEWFNVFGPHGRPPGDWGSWSGRGMNWNSNCAACHMTNFQKNYDIATDSYNSRWDEMGIGCTQCHTVTPNHLKEPTGKSVSSIDRVRAMETCLSCHSRREELTLNFKPGESYADHYRLALPDQSGLYYPDGQALDEVFVGGSFLMSRMGGVAKVNCLDCHDPHSGETLLPSANNALCMSCHATPGRLGAVSIDPVAHSHHPDGTTGNSCIECHMTFTTYMERDPRRDHGFHSPDPLLTKELGIPNACNKCHTDKSIEWAVEWSERWYGNRLDRRQRARARLVSRVYNSDPKAFSDLIHFLRDEDIPAWRAAFVGMLEGQIEQPGIAEAIKNLASDSDPLVRSSVIRALSRSEQYRDIVRQALTDSVRLVRLSASWALAQRNGLTSIPQPELRNELTAWLQAGADQPAGATRKGQLAFAERRDEEAFGWYERAISWDPLSIPLYTDLAVMKSARRDLAGALAVLERGIRSVEQPGDLAMMAGLVEAELGNLSGAETRLREAVRHSPRLARAWYNLGLLLSQKNRLSEAIECLLKAENIETNVADYAYAQATLYLRSGATQSAIESLNRALNADPTHEPSRQLKKRLENPEAFKN